jgi:hypothetical protein
LPWASLVLGIASAVTMDRRPERARWVALAAGAGWLLLGALALLGRNERSFRGGGRGRFRSLAARGAVMGTRSLMQLCLFFATPFFVAAAAVPAHWAFVAVLIAAAAVTLWDPLHDAALRHPLAGPTLQAIATFAGLDCVLPVLGLSNRASLIAATAWTALGLPLAALTTAPPPVRGRRTALAGVAAAALAAALLFGAAHVIPPAPLRFVDGALGTRLADRRILAPVTSLPSVPPELYCATAISAPRGLRDRLRHVWRLDGRPIAEVPLEIRGGRVQGFRTWSVKHNLAPGRWTCSVETESGQLLGRVTILIER